VIVIIIIIIIIIIYLNIVRIVNYKTRYTLK